jgi:hypothetical protein
MSEKTKSILEKIKSVILNEDEKKEEITLEEMSLKDGAGMLFAESFVEGESVYMLLEDGERQPLPAGEYELEDGRMLMVEVEGVIASVSEATAEEEPTPEPVAEEMKAEEPTPEPNKVEEQLSEVVTELTKQNQKMKKELESRASDGIKASPEGKAKRVTLSAPKAAMNPAERVHLAMQNTPIYQKVNLATTTSITSTYAGESAGMYIAAAVLQGSTLGTNAITIKPNIKYKEVVKKLALVNGNADRTCDFTEAGSITLTERILTPKELQINLQLCKGDFRNDWDAISMGYSAWDVLPPSFEAFLLEQVALGNNQTIEQNIWHGVAATDGQFGGLVPLMTADADVIDEAGTTVTAANVVAEMGTVVDKIPSSIRFSPDMRLYVSQAVGSAYIRALGGFSVAATSNSGVGAQGTQWYNGQGLSFDGIPIVITPGLNTYYMVAAERTNLWFGTGLLNDTNDVRVIDMTPTDGSDNVRVVVKYTAGVQYGIGAEIVLYTPA